MAAPVFFMPDTATIGAPVHGPGGLLATPGLAVPRRKSRKGTWGGQRLKAAADPQERSEIARRAALARWGKYTPGSRTARGVQLSKQPKLTAPKPAAAPKKGRAAGGKKGGGRATDPAKAKRQAERDAYTQMRREQIQQDRAERQKRQQEREMERKVQQKLREEEKRKRDEEKGKKGGGGGGKGKGDKQPTPEQQAREARRAEAEARRERAATERQAAQQQRLNDSIDAFSAGVRLRPTQVEALIDAGLAQRNGPMVELTNAGRKVASRSKESQRSKAYGRPAGSAAATSAVDGRARRAHPEAHHVRPDVRAAVRPRGTGTPGHVDHQQVGGSARPAGADQGLGSLTVYKDAAGRARWIAVSTTAYYDRDREVLPIAVLDADSQRMTATGKFGPLRWWHVGQPNALDPTAPWGPGVDLGMCDYSAQVGTHRIESGTFYDQAVAERIQQSAKDFELSPGFFHTEDQPGPDGVFQAIHTFERSLVPVRHGRASNLYTALTVKEQRQMKPDEVQRRLKAMGEALGLTPEQVATFAQQIAQTDKAAAQQGVTFKSAGAQPVYSASDGSLFLVQDGRAVALKAAIMPEAKADMMPAPTPAEVAADVVEEEIEEDTGLLVGDMTMEELGDMLIRSFTTAIQQFGGDLQTRMAAMDEQLKTLGYSRMKEAQEADAIKAQIATLEAKLKSLTEDQPANTLSPDIEAALKSAGPQTPTNPATPQIPIDDPVRATAMAAWPDIYPGFQPTPVRLP